MSKSTHIVEVTFPDGTTQQQRTKRNVTHVVAVLSGDPPRWHVGRWSTSESIAYRAEPEVRLGSWKCNESRVLPTRVARML